MEPTTLLVDIADGVATVTLNRPEALNAFDPTMMLELQACWRALRADDDVRAVVLTGAGERAFCTGLDRVAVTPGDVPEDSPIGYRGSSPLHFDDPGELISPKSANDLWKPIVAAVNGMACGGAFYLLGEVDIIVAAESATFFDPHTTYGMPAVYEPLLMASRMPLGEILHLSLVGAHERMSAQRAHTIGMVQEVVPDGELLASAQRLAATIASQPALAVQATLRAIWFSQQLGGSTALQVAKAMVAVGTSDASLAEGNARFASGQRIEWRKR